MIHALPTTRRHIPTPDRDAVRGFGMPAILALMVLLCSSLGFSGAGSRTIGMIANAAEAAASAMADARDGDPPHLARHRALHLKKPRLTALQVCTRPDAPMCPSFAIPADNLRLGAPDEAGAFVAPDAAHADRTDPALRLHPGQAPPHVA